MAALLQMSADAAMRQRLHVVLEKYGGLLLLGLAYFAFIRITGLSLPCPIRFVTGFLCPGCGITDMFLALFAGDMAAAFHANELLFCTGPLILALMLYDELLWVRTGIHPRQPAWIWRLLLVMFSVFTLWRNF